MTGNRTWNVTESELGAVPGTGSQRGQNGIAQSSKNSKSIRIITKDLIRTMKLVVQFRFLCNTKAHLGAVASTYLRLCLI